MAKYKILSKDNSTQLFVNEEEVQHLKSIEFIHNHNKDSLPVLRAEVYMIDKNELEIDIDNEK